jgi:protein-disulfide isomerase
METNKTSPLTIPAAIVIAATIIAIAVIYVKNPTPPVVKNTAAETQAVTINLSPVTSSDHIFGNPNAAIKIVEYSDSSCPYCKTFNPTMEDIISQYGPSGNVAWVYRHFPLDIHKNAIHEAEALECAASVGGNDKFWAFEKKLYETTPSVTGSTPDGLDQTKLPVMAKAVGIDVQAFNDCLSGGTFKDSVDKQLTSGVNAGVSGTPTSFLVLSTPASKAVTDYIDNTLLTYKIPPSMLFISSDKKTILMSGALPKELITGLIGAIQSN